MPYAKKVVTTEAVLELIKPGQIYAPYNLGRQLRAPSVDVRKVLLDLVKQGKLSTITPHHTLCFILKNTEHLRRKAPAKPVIDPATVAQPRRYAVLTGELTGYFAEMYERADLALIGRGMR